MTLPTQTSTILYLLLAALVALAILFAATAAFFVLWSVFLLSSRFHLRTSPAWCKVLQRFGWHGKLKRASEASRIVLSQGVSGSLRNHDSDDARGLFFRLEAYSGLDESSSTWHVTVAVELRTSLLTGFVALAMTGARKCCCPRDRIKFGSGLDRGLAAKTWLGCAISPKC